MADLARPLDWGRAVLPWPRWQLPAGAPLLQ
jgi:hypothetical protein